MRNAMPSDPHITYLNKVCIFVKNLFFTGYETDISLNHALTLSMLMMLVIEFLASDVRPSKTSVAGQHILSNTIFFLLKSNYLIILDFVYV